MTMNGQWRGKKAVAESAAKDKVVAAFLRAVIPLSEAGIFLLR